MMSLRQRFQRFWFVGLLIGFGLQWALAAWVLNYSTETYVLSRLKHDLEDIQLALEIKDMGLPSMQTQELNPVFQRPFSGYYYHLRVSGMELYSASLWQFPLDLIDLPPGSSGVTEQAGPMQQWLLVYHAHVLQNGHSIQVAVAEDISPLQATLRYFSLLYALLSLGLLILLLGLQTWLLKRSLAPLKTITGQIEALLQGEIRALDEHAPAEVQPLIQAFNRLLQVLERRLKRSRNALSNLAHALKQPLGQIRRTLEMFETKGSPQHQVLLKQSDMIQHLIEHELRRGQLAGAAPLAEKIQLDQELPVLIQWLQSAYPDKSLNIQFRLSEEAVLGDRQDLLELCGNLLDNAFKWANRQIRVSVSTHSGFCLCIEDDGPGCPETQWPRLLERGTRLDRNQPGHGLGLSIVHEITEAYGGQLILGHSSDLGGFCVSVSWP